MKRVLIVSYVPFYNRQGHDLHECLAQAGCRSTLLQLDAKTDGAKRIIGVRQTKPHGALHSFHVLLNMLRFVFHAIFVKKDVIVAIGRPALPIARFLKSFSKCKVVYYALEYTVFAGRDKAIIKSCVDKIIDVEDNRLARLKKDNHLELPSMVVYNMPHRHAMPLGGELRRYLKENYQVPQESKIVVYAGSYQSYACADKIVDAARLLPRGVYVVFMTYNLPAQIRDSAPDNVFVVPPVSGEPFYDWLFDADCALLPYESKTDFNVQCCSPQKIYDCYLAGVPFVASKRPIVVKTISSDESVAKTCDFTNPSDVAHAIRSMIELPREETRARMHCLHDSRFNYDLYGDKIVNFVTG